MALPTSSFDNIKGFITVLYTYTLDYDYNDDDDPSDRFRPWRPLRLLIGCLALMRSKMAYTIQIRNTKIFIYLFKVYCTQENYTQRLHKEKYVSQGDKSMCMV